MLRFSGQQHASASSQRKTTKRKTVLPDNTISSIDKTFGDTTDYSNLAISSLSNLEIPTTTKRLILDNNPILSLEGLMPLPSLVSLSLVNSQFETFRGFPSFANLAEINVTGTPILNNPSFKSGFLILIPSLKKINGQMVTRNERKLAEAFNKKTSVLLRNGWAPTLHPPSEDETNHILTRLISMKKASKSGNSQLAEKSRKSSSHAVSLKEKMDESIAQHETEIKRLQELVDKKKTSTRSPRKPLLLPKFAKTEQSPEKKEEEVNSTDDSKQEITEEKEEETKPEINEKKVEEINENKEEETKPEIMEEKEEEIKPELTEIKEETNPEIIEKKEEEETETIKGQTPEKSQEPIPETETETLPF